MIKTDNSVKQTGHLCWSHLSRSWGKAELLGLIEVFNDALDNVIQLFLGSLPIQSEVNKNDKCKEVVLINSDTNVHKTIHVCTLLMYTCMSFSYCM